MLSRCKSLVAIALAAVSIHAMAVKPFVLRTPNYTVIHYPGMTPYALRTLNYVKLSSEHWIHESKQTALHVNPAWVARHLHSLSVGSDPDFITDSDFSGPNLSSARAVAALATLQPSAVEQSRAVFSPEMKNLFQNHHSVDQPRTLARAATLPKPSTIEPARPVLSPEMMKLIQNIQIDKPWSQSDFPWFRFQLKAANE